MAWLLLSAACHAPGPGTASLVAVGGCADDSQPGRPDLGAGRGATRLASGAVTGWQIPALATACSTLGWAEKTPGSR
jgi:hypothetical protein